MAFAEDFSAFFRADEFASAATLGGVAVRGIFDKAYELADAGGNGFASTLPVFTLPTSSVPASVTGLPLVIAGVIYTVVLSEPDGTGVTQLMLEKA